MVREMLMQKGVESPQNFSILFDVESSVFNI